MKSEKDIDRDYYLTHRKKVLERTTNYYQNNKEKIKKYKHNWYLKKKLVIPI